MTVDADVAAVLFEEESWLDAAEVAALARYVDVRLVRRSLEALVLDGRAERRSGLRRQYRARIGGR